MQLLRISTIFTLILLVFISLVACERETSDQKVIMVTTFDEIFIDSLIPIEGKSYFGYYIRITGYANDSIRIVPGLDEQNYFSFFYKDSIDEELSMDFYGTFPTHITFDPYNATKGNLQIEYRLLGF